MKCVQCGQTHPDSAPTCPHCGFKYVVETAEDQRKYFNAIKDVLESAYTQGETPWNQSGKSGGYEDWVRLRIPVAECMDNSGTFLDIGCANGYLIECVLEWVKHKGIEIKPYGLDFAPEVLEMAKARLPKYQDHLYLGNAWDWEPPQMFDYVRVELVYVPVNLRPEFIQRLLERYVSPSGKLLLAQYRSSREDLSGGWLDDEIRELGYEVADIKHGFNGNGQELCRIVVLTKKLD